MENMRFKVGDRVRIKSIDWYNENKDEYGYIDCGSRAFFTKMSDWCGKIATIKEICKTNCYRLEEYDFDWTDEMIEGLVEEETYDFLKTDISDPTKLDVALDILDRTVILPEGKVPDGYILKDENGNVINAMKVVLEKKKKECPKTYEECCIALEYIPHTDDIIGYKWDILQSLQKLLICRDAYWKIAGEEMSLGKPWEPRWNDGHQKKYCIYNGRDDIQEDVWLFANFILAFPTEEMRDAFYENFKSEIEICKELL